MSEPQSLDPAEERALRELIDELRGAPLPELDWSRVEGSLLQRIELEAARRRRRSWGAVLVAAAAAALVALVFGTLSTGEPELNATGAPPAGERDDSHAPSEDAPAQNGSETSAGERAPASERVHPVADLGSGALVHSDAKSVSFTLPGAVTWTLAPHSEVVVESVAVPHRVRLRRGRIEAEVVPREPGDPGESFAVVAGTTRVAVRGTVFTVARHDAAVTVEVSRGKVAVGATSGQDLPQLLLGPSSARFSLEGGKLLSHLKGRKPKTAQLDDHEGSAEQPIAASPREVPSEQDHVGSSASAPASEGPAAPEAEAPTRLSVSQAQGLVFGCLRRAIDAGENESKVTISSNVKVVLGAGGEVDAVRFSPPLRPDLQQQCGGALFGTTLEGEGSVGFHVKLTR